jgi:hypothetical protein
VVYQRAGLKPWKEKKAKLKLTLGRDLGMKEAGHYSLRGLVGKFGYKAMEAKEIHNWVSECWGPVLSYIPEAYIFSKGWFCFLFQSPEDAEQILNKVWIVKNGSLMLKCWHVAFNPKKEIIRYRHLQVLMFGCPLLVWNREAFREIGNAIGKFLFVDSGLLAGSDRSMGKIILDIDMFEVLSIEIEIVW